MLGKLRDFLTTRLIMFSGAPTLTRQGQFTVKSNGKAYVYYSGAEQELGAGGGGGAPTTAQYLTLALDGSLSAERRFVTTLPLSAADGGANGDYTLSLSGWSGTTDGDMLYRNGTAVGSKTAAQVRSFLSLVVGTNVQAWGTDLDQLDALGDGLPYRNAGTWGAANPAGMLSVVSGAWKVVGLRESGGQDLGMGALADGALLSRSGTSVVGATVATTAAASVIVKALASGLIDASFLPSTGGSGAAPMAAGYSTGRHGSITLAAGGGSIVSGLIAWDAGRSEYYLLTNLIPRNLTIDASVVLAVRGYRIMVYDTLTLGASAVIHADGYAAVANAAGAGSPPAATTAFFAGGGNGAAGRTTTGNGTASSAVASTIRAGGVGGNGGDSYSNSVKSHDGGTAASGTAWAVATHGERNGVTTPQARDVSGNYALGGLGGASGALNGTLGGGSYSGAGGGGGGVLVVVASTAVFGAGAVLRANGAAGANGNAVGGASGGVNANGGGGGGGGEILVVFTTITGTCACEANGAAGGNGSSVIISGGGNTYSGGGGGGNGGYIEAFTTSGTITASVTGGAAGTPASVNGGTGTNEAAGSAGTSYICPVA